MYRHLFRHLDSVGDGSGAKNATGNYSITPQDFSFLCERPCELHRMIFLLQDNSGMSAQEYANLGSALPNGYCFELIDEAGNVAQDLCDGVPIQTNAGIGRLCYDVDLKTWGAGDECILARWTFTKAGKPIELTPGERIRARLNDDFSPMVAHYFFLQGIWQRDSAGRYPTP